MRISSILLFGVAVVMGLGAAILAMNWIEGQRTTQPIAAISPNTSVRKVVVASQPLRFGNEITSVNLKEVEWPAGAVPAGSFLSLADLTKPGERRVVLSAIERDEPILAWKITGAGQRASLSAVIGSDKTAVTIRVNDVSGAAGFVLPGDRVDVLLTRTEDKGGVNDVLLQNVRALAVDQLADERTEKPSVAKAVTLEVTQSQAQRLALAQTVGQLSLALRPAGATSENATRRVGMADLGQTEVVARQVETAAIVVPISLPLVTIGVTRGLRRDEYSNVSPERRTR